MEGIDTTFIEPSHIHSLNWTMNDSSKNSAGIGARSDFAFFALFWPNLSFTVLLALGPPMARISFLDLKCWTETTH